MYDTQVWNKMQFTPLSFERNDTHKHSGVLQKYLNLIYFNLRKRAVLKRLKTPVIILIFYTTNYYFNGLDS